MLTKLPFFSTALAAMMLLGASTQVSALTYTIGFTAKGDTTAVGSVLVQNITKATSVTVPEGCELSLNVISTGLNDLNADNAGITVTQQADGKYILTYYAKQAGQSTIDVFSLNGNKLIGQSNLVEFGTNNVEIEVPAGNYVVRVYADGYSYSTKMQSKVQSSVQANIKWLGTSKTNVLSSAQKVKSGAAPQITMDYTAGDQLKYIATTGKFKAVLTDKPSASKTVNFFYVATCNIPGGTFMMGSPSTEVDRGTDEVQHLVTISPFRFGTYEVTNTQFADFLNAVGVDEFGFWDNAPTYKTKQLLCESIEPNNFGLRHTTKWEPVAGYEKAPIIFVSWYGAYEYCAYVGGKLPTEAQAEYALRAGTTTAFGTGDFITNLQANYDWTLPYNGNTITVPILNKTVPVGSYAPNAWGLYDIHGNIAAWCSDWYGPYPTDAVTNPTGPATGNLKTIRGGNYLRSAAKTRCAYRNSASTEFLGRATGIRVAFDE